MKTKSLQELQADLEYVKDQQVQLVDDFKNLSSPECTRKLIALAKQAKILHLKIKELISLRAEGPF